MIFLLFFFIACHRQVIELNIWQKIQSSWTDEIESIVEESNEIAWLSSLPFIAVVLSQAEHYGIPSDVVLLPFILSQYNNTASNTDQQGFWQIHHKNCVIYNLSCQANYDERKHPLLATTAVMIRMKELYGIHRSWKVTFLTFYQEQLLYRHELQELGTVSQALGKLKYLVNSLFEKNLLPYISIEPFFEAINIPSNLSIIEIAQLSFIDSELWYQLNSFFVSGVTSKEHFSVLVPVNTININLPKYGQQTSEISLSIDIFTKSYANMKHGQDLAILSSQASHPKINKYYYDQA